MHEYSLSFVVCIEVLCVFQGRDQRKGIHARDLHFPLGDMVDSNIN